jgi:hypothetical protein
VIWERKALIRRCYLLRECSERCLKCTPLASVYTHCQSQPLAIICFDCTLRSTTTAFAPGFRAFKSSHPHPVVSHPTAGMAILDQPTCYTPNRNSWQTSAQKTRRGRGLLSWGQLFKSQTMHCCPCLGNLRGLFVFLSFAGLLARSQYASGRSCDRPSRHRFSSAFLGHRANAEMVPKIPSCCCVLLMQPTRFKQSKSITLLYRTERKTITCSTIRFLSKRNQNSAALL